MANGPAYQPGFYGFEVLEVGFGQSKNNNPQICIRGRIAGYFDDSDPDHTLMPVDKNWERTIKLTISEKNEESKKYTLMKLREAGFDSDNFSDLPACLEGKTIEAVCEHEEGNGEYAGKVFERWDLKLPPRVSEPLEKRPEVAMTLNNLFGADLKAGAKPKAKKPAKQTVPEDGGDIPDDSIPF